ncbi:MAG: four helix bundle protein, partial [Muribaculaceae bacterium]|nr:four helix bundle protein [Muribaculaceae bacterium]
MNYVLLRINPKINIMVNSDFRQLSVWQKAMDISEEIYDLIDTLPGKERFALCDQMRRCVISIPSNIAEGQRRNSNKEFIHFLSISRGSAAELQTQLLLCQRFRYSDEHCISCLFDKLTE